MRLLARRGRLGMTVFLFGCGFAALSSAREIEINILHTADLHGHLAPVWAEDRGEISGLPADAAHQAGGLLRCATIINGIRAQETNVVLIDCGDLFQGSAESYLTRGEVMIKAVKHLRYDALVVGNHEFDWGAEQLRALYRKAEIPVLTAGIAAPEDKTLPWSRPFLVRQIDGVKLVIIGLTNPLIPKWQRPRLLGDLQFPKTRDALRAALAQARKIKPDILILAVHQGWRQWGDYRGNNINSIAKAFPDFDLIIGAHTHQAIEAQEINRILYTQAGCYGLWLGKVRCRFDSARHALTKIEAQLIPVGADVSPDAALEELVADDLRSAKSYLRRKVGNSEHKITPEEKMPGQSEVQTLIAAAISAATEAAVVFHGTLSSATLPRGAVRMADVWRIVPYENTIGKAWLTLAEMREILEENSRYYGKSQFRGVYGIIYELNPSAPPGKRVSNLCLVNGRKIKSDEKISFAVNSYDLASAGGRFPRLREIMERPEARLEETDKDTREAVIKYISVHSPLDIEVAPGARIVKGRSKIGGASFVKREASENTNDASRGTLHVNPD
ncbi:MAG: bifunctional UDP-sugar hydrolase/5'-nucleotidase [Kiritimatiellia bacterium]|nr:bifunctional UDP-sugar hydrolase/5'-nucleotidase [Kiritimatiellia bacterium]